MSDVVTRGEGTGLGFARWSTAVLFNGSWRNAASSSAVRVAKTSATDCANRRRATNASVSAEA
jgi:hypothetical protein